MQQTRFRRTFKEKSLAYHRYFLYLWLKSTLYLLSPLSLREQFFLALSKIASRIVCAMVFQAIGRLAAGVWCLPLAPFPFFFFVMIMWVGGMMSIFLMAASATTLSSRFLPPRYYFFVILACLMCGALITMPFFHAPTFPCYTTEAIVWNSTCWLILVPAIIVAGGLLRRDTKAAEREKLA